MNLHTIIAAAAFALMTISPAAAQDFKPVTADQVRQLVASNDAAGLTELLANGEIVGDLSEADRKRGSNLVGSHLLKVASDDPMKFMRLGRAILAIKGEEGAEASTASTSTNTPISAFLRSNASISRLHSASC